MFLDVGIAVIGGWVRVCLMLVLMAMDSVGLAKMNLPRRTSRRNQLSLGKRWVGSRLIFLVWWAVATLMVTLNLQWAECLRW